MRTGTASTRRTPGLPAASGVDLSSRKAVMVDKSQNGHKPPECRAGADMPFCQALAPAVVAALAWAIFRLTIALGGSCCAIAQRLTALTMAIPLIPMPHMLIRPPVAMRANPTIMALEFGELSCMPVTDDRVLVIVSPGISVVLRCLAFPAGPAGSHPRRGMSPTG